eukprot:CAMPEP_0194281824 /NCGR_PEP_ID=MMETSP0169-20130528/21640_1 /TAXON_ID=218684 /ORGANISM="Corethron pennatum, Strain L29A3" /LENGTH=341 /DNA_ID=CAMNT_0039026987 /DNA_START=64 /DNA_END=1089 /DNA_ORIENTATION=+
MSSVQSSANDPKQKSYVARIQSRYDSSLFITGKQELLSSDTLVCCSGKVRDRFDSPSSPYLALVTTDRQSGFDRLLGHVPYKGQVLNLTSAYWFDLTKDIIGNHLVDIPHPNVSVVKKCKPFPIEFVVRAYMTGSTSTSIWKNYQNGVRKYCGHDLPEGLVKSQKLSEVILTPTTKEEEHDRPISAEEIVSEGWMTQDDFDICAKAAIEIFQRGQKIAGERGLILVDTKFELGKDSENTIILIDEALTPDSSRYWLAGSYSERFAEGKEPENIDKEFLRLWFRDRCDPYNDKVIPDPPKDLVVELSRRYVMLFEMITGKDFQFDDRSEDTILSAIRSALEK